MASIEFPFAIEYDTDSRVPVNLVAKSLLAHEALIKESAELLEDAICGARIQVGSVHVRQISNNSPLTQMLGAALLVTYQETLVEEVPALIESLSGVVVPDEYSTIVTVTAIILVVTVAEQLVVRATQSKKAVALRQNYARRLYELSELTSVPEDKLDELIKERSEGAIKKRLLMAVADFLSPSIKTERGQIRAHGNEAITKEAIGEIPASVLDQELENIDGILIEDARVEIIRSARDSSKSGWRSIIHSQSDRKIRTVVTLGIDLAELYPKTEIVADVFVTQQRNEDGDVVPQSYQILAIKD